jgi:hypothetical protein
LKNIVRYCQRDIFSIITNTCVLFPYNKWDKQYAVSLPKYLRVVEVNIIIITTVYLKQKFVPMFVTKIYGGVETLIHSLLIPTLRWNGQLHIPAALFQYKESSVPVTQDAERNPNPAWTLSKMKSLTPAGNRTMVSWFSIP